MTYQEFVDVNQSEGLGATLVYVNDVTHGLFLRSVLFAIFLIAFLGTYFSTKREGQPGDLSVCFAAAGYFTLGAAVISSFIEGLIDPFTIIFCIAIAIVGSLWLLMAKVGE